MNKNSDKPGEEKEKKDDIGLTKEETNISSSQILSFLKGRNFISSNNVSSNSPTGDSIVAKTKSEEVPKVDKEKTSSGSIQNSDTDNSKQKATSTVSIKNDDSSAQLYTLLANKLFAATSGTQGVDDNKKEDIGTNKEKPLSDNPVNLTSVTDKEKVVISESIAEKKIISNEPSLVGPSLAVEKNEKALPPNLPIPEVSSENKTNQASLGVLPQLEKIDDKSLPTKTASLITKSETIILADTTQLNVKKDEALLDKLETPAIQSQNDDVGRIGIEKGKQEPLVAKAPLLDPILTKVILEPSKESVKSELREKNFSPLIKNNEEKLKNKPLISVEQAYIQSLGYAEKLFDVNVNLTNIDFEDISSVVKFFISYCRKNDQVLIENVFSNSSTGGNFFVFNLVNVCILSIEVGVALGYNDKELLNLGLAAFYHDVGMKKDIELIKQSKTLTLVERRQIQKHPTISCEILRSIVPFLDPIIFEIIEQEHERLDGSGYPRSLKGNAINEYAQLVGLTDMYEALTHFRPYRQNKYSPVDAFKIIITNKLAFSHKLIKTFLNQLGLYPRSFLVELNTKEVGQVLMQNVSMPTCPKINIIYDSVGKKVEKNREIDLSKRVDMYITKSLAENMKV